MHIALRPGALAQLGSFLQFFERDIFLQSAVPSHLQSPEDESHEYEFPGAANRLMPDGAPCNWVTGEFPAAKTWAGEKSAMAAINAN